MEPGSNEQMARVVSHHAMLNAKFVKSSSARLRGSAGSPSRGENPHGWGPWVAKLGKWSWPQPAGRYRVRAERVLLRCFCSRETLDGWLQSVTRDTQPDIGPRWRPQRIYKACGGSVGHPAEQILGLHKHTLGLTVR